MGDSGSLTIGAILSVLTIQLIETPTDFLHPVFKNISTPIFAIAILSFPLLDTLRVFVSRTLKGKSPLTADRNHLHHKLQDKGYGHKRVVFVIYFFSVTIAAIAAFLPTPYPTVTFGACALTSLAFILFAVYPRKTK